RPALASPGAEEFISASTVTPLALTVAPGPVVAVPSPTVAELVMSATLTATPAPMEVLLGAPALPAALPSAVAGASVSFEGGAVGRRDSQPVRDVGARRGRLDVDAQRRGDVHLALAGLGRRLDGLGLGGVAVAAAGRHLAGEVQLLSSLAVGAVVAVLGRVGA